MNIEFRQKTAIVYDFTRALLFKVNGIDIIEENAKRGLETSDRVISAFDFIWDGLDHNVPGVNLFFYRNEQNLFYINSEYDKRLHEFADINELIHDAFEGPVEELQVKVLGYYDNNRHDHEYYRKLIRDKSKTYELIDALHIPLRCKWELKGIIDSPMAILDPLIQFCHRLRRELRNVYKNNIEYMKMFNKEMQVKINNNPLILFSELSSFFKHDFENDDRDIYISYSFLNEFLASSYVDGSSWYITLGLNYMNVLKLLLPNDDLSVNDAFLKAFSDKHRMGIVRLLMNGEMYVCMIADRMGMILSTTSYHLDKLLSARILTGRPEGKKIYYKVNKAYLKKKFKELSERIDKGSF